MSATIFTASSHPLDDSRPAIAFSNSHSYLPLPPSPRAADASLRIYHTLKAKHVLALSVPLGGAAAGAGSTTMSESGSASASSSSSTSSSSTAIATDHHKSSGGANSAGGSSGSIAGVSASYLGLR